MGMDITYLTIVLVTILLSMTLHEAMHAFLGYFLGDDTAKAQGRLSLNPIKHIDPIMTIALPLFLAVMGGPIFGGARPVPLNPHRIRYGEWGMALVAVAGPLTNFLLAFLFFGIGVLTGVINSVGSVASYDSYWSIFISYGVMVNLSFFIFNMLPIPPLDGSRVLYALAPEMVQRGMEKIEQYGIFLVLAIVMLAMPVIGSIMISANDVLWAAFSFIFRLGL